MLLVDAISSILGNRLSPNRFLHLMCFSDALISRGVGSHSPYNMPGDYILSYKKVENGYFVVLNKLFPKEMVAALIN